jgi:hypothetical protein
MEMDCVAHCGEANRGSYVNSLVLTDIASGWTEAAPLVVRESGLLVETLERVRLGLPFALRALDVKNGSEFVNESLINYCLTRGIELTRSRPWRKNDQAWIEQKNGAVVRKRLGASNSSGGVMGKMISPQNITTGLAVTNLKGCEGTVLARTFRHSVVLTLILVLIVVIQQYWLTDSIPGYQLPG